MHPAEDLIGEIRRLLATRDEAGVRRALELTHRLPLPGNANDDLTAQCLFDTGFGIEFFGEDDTAIVLYRRVVLYPVADAKYTADAWYRIGVCVTRQANFGEAVRAYREALSIPGGRPHMIALAHFHLGELLEASEEYRAAADCYTNALKFLPHPHMEDERVYLGFARCAWRAGRSREPIPGLRTIAAKTENAASVEAWRLLAEIAEECGDYFDAERSYREIIANSHSDEPMRVAAAWRMESLQKRSIGRRAAGMS